MAYLLEKVVLNLGSLSRVSLLFEGTEFAVKTRITNLM